LPPWLFVTTGWPGLMAGAGTVLARAGVHPARLLTVSAVGATLALGATVLLITHLLRRKTRRSCGSAS
jgi:uncharacterized membrane protein YphA (DoxX/SURF4 family)